MSEPVCVEAVTRYTVAARVRTAPRFVVESRTRLFDGEAYRSLDLNATLYFVTPDDQRFMMIKQIPGAIPGWTQAISC